MIEPSHDPFTQVEQRLWDALGEHRDITSRVRLANRSPTRAGQMRSLPADLPQIDIRPTTCKVHLFATSTSSLIEQGYTIGLATGAHCPAHSLNPLRWAIMLAISQVGDTLGLPFVEKVQLSDQRLQLTEPGWSAVLNLVVHMRFDNRHDLNLSEPIPWN